MKKWDVFAFALLFVGVCSASCGRAVSTSNASPVNTPDAAMHTSPLTTPTAISPPTPSSGEVGTVVGFLLEGGDTPQPVGQVRLYLGEVVRSADGTPAMARMDRQTAPSAQTDANGRFVFADVPPGQHTLFLDVIVRVVVLDDPSSGGDLLIEVEGGTITDLGELIYPELPSRP